MVTTKKIYFFNTDYHCYMFLHWNLTTTLKKLNFLIHPSVDKNKLYITLFVLKLTTLFVF